MKLPDLRCILMFIVMLAALAGPVSATNFVHIFVHPGSGTVCLDNDCQVSVGTLSGYSSTSFREPTCGVDHTITVYNTAGYEDYTDTVYVAANCYDVTRSIYLAQVPRETATESSSPDTGIVQVYISPGPAAAEVCLDNLMCQVNDGPAADTWSVQFADVSSGEQHILAVQADGYQPASKQVAATAGQISTINIALVPVATGTDTSTTTASAPTAKTASPLGIEVVVLAIGAVGAFALFRNRS